MTVAKAASADTATNATTAGNATNLNGQAATAYQSRVGIAFGTDVIIPSASEAVSLAAPLSLTVPAGQNVVLATGSTSVRTGNSFGSLWIQVDGAACAATGVGFTSRAFFFAPTTGEASVSTSLAVLVAPGVHTIRLCARSGADANARGTSLTAQTAAGGSTGGPGLKSTGAKAPATDVP